VVKGMEVEDTEWEAGVSQPHGRACTMMSLNLLVLAEVVEADFKEAEVARMAAIEALHLLKVVQQAHLQLARRLDLRMLANLVRTIVVEAEVDSGDSILTRGVERADW